MDIKFFTHVFKKPEQEMRFQGPHRASPPVVSCTLCPEYPVSGPHFCLLCAGLLAWETSRWDIWHQASACLIPGASPEAASSWAPFSSPWLACQYLRQPGRTPLKALALQVPLGLNHKLQTSPCTLIFWPTNLPEFQESWWYHGQPDG